MGRQKDADGPKVNGERLLLEVRSPDGEVRGEAVRSLCPCHAGWQVFGRHAGVVMRAMRHRDRGVRAHALHVFEEAARMRSAEEADCIRQGAEEAARRKRPSRLRPAGAAWEARRQGKLRAGGRRR